MKPGRPNPSMKKEKSADGWPLNHRDCGVPHPSDGFGRGGMAEAMR